MQLAAGFDRNKALAMYARAVKRLTAVIGDRDPSLLSSVMRSRGTRAFYQVRIGADTRPEADDLCNRIRKAGGACFVLRNRVVRGRRIHSTAMSIRLDPRASLDAQDGLSPVMTRRIHQLMPVMPRAALRSIHLNGIAPRAPLRGGCARSRSTVLTLVLFATYLGIGALAHDTHFCLVWALLEHGSSSGRARRRSS